VRSRAKTTREARASTICVENGQRLLNGGWATLRARYPAIRPKAGGPIIPFSGPLRIMRINTER
jgi:hypothetical protein